MQENTTAGASFSNPMSPQSGAFVKGSYYKKYVKTLKELWIKHKTPSSIGKVPDFAGNKTQDLKVFNTADQDSAAEFYKQMLRCSMGPSAQ